MQNQALKAVATEYAHWLRQQALPLWWQSGADHHEGGFHELLDQQGKPAGQFRRARVQGRQSYVYAQAGLMGWQGPWKEAAPHGIDYLKHRYARDDGQFRTLVGNDGAVLDDTAMLYDQAFALLGSATILKAMPERTDLKGFAHTLFARIVEARKHPQGGFVETGAKGFLSNPHMHLLESLLAWCEAEPGADWGTYADHVAELALTRFIDAEHGFLREYFDADWAPAPGDDGHVVEPGHQFEWAWLLMRWGSVRGHAEVRSVAQKLFEHGCRGIDPARQAAVHAMNDSFAVTVPTARLWAQTERIKAALVLAEDGDDPILQHALNGAATLKRYLATPKPGLWLDRFEPDGHFKDEPSPASSLYHIICCIACLEDAAGLAEAEKAL